MNIKRRHLQMARAARRCLGRRAAALNENFRWAHLFSNIGWILVKRWHDAANHKGNKQ